MSAQLKLSEAIREGAKLRPQARFAFYSWVNGELASCALGAAMEATFGRVLKYEEREEVQDSFYSELAEVYRNCPSDTASPDCYMGTAGLLYQVAHLNDHHGWTRTRIADWLESEGF